MVGAFNGSLVRRINTIIRVDRGQCVLLVKNVQCRLDIVILTSALTSMKGGGEWI